MFDSVISAKYAAFFFFFFFSKVNDFWIASKTSSALKPLLQICTLPMQVVSVPSADTLTGILGSIQNQQCYLFLFDDATTSPSRAQVNRTHS